MFPTSSAPTRPEYDNTHVISRINVVLEHVQIVQGGTMRAYERMRMLHAWTGVREGSEKNMGEEFRELGGAGSPPAPAGTDVAVAYELVAKSLRKVCSV